LTSATGTLNVETDAPLPTWFGIGGRADRLARPGDVAALVRCLEVDSDLRVIGDGANLLVDDDGVPELVVDFKPGAHADSARSDGTTNEFSRVDIDDATGEVTAGAGADLRKLINETVRRGLAGLEVLAGIPATVGGAIVMNAGGAFGQIGDVVTRVEAVDRAGRMHTYTRDRIDFGYRHSGLTHLIITRVGLKLARVEAAGLREKLKEVTAYKARTQPLKENSAGCVFKNPTLLEDLDDLGRAGQRVSAGMLIDRAGCKGLAKGGASVSHVHANFVVTTADARARDVIDLMAETASRVLDRFGVRLEPEVVIWRRPEHR
jgi:UDP-N-acetylmuramate dehydrogenase